MSLSEQIISFLDKSIYARQGMSARVIAAELGEDYTDVLEAVIIGVQDEKLEVVRSKTGHLIVHPYNPPYIF